MDKAIENLKDICFLLPPFPIDDLTFIENVIVQRNNREELEYTTQNDKTGTNPNATMTGNLVNELEGTTGFSFI